MFIRVSKILLEGKHPEHLESLMAIVTSESRSHFENIFQGELHMLCVTEIPFVLKNIKLLFVQKPGCRCVEQL